MQAQRYWVAPSSANWSNPANWSLQSGGPGGASVPQAGDQVHFDENGLGNCILDRDVHIESIRIQEYTSTIQLNGYIFRVNGEGTNIFEDGLIDDVTAASFFQIDFRGTSRFTGTIFNVEVDITSDRLYLNGSTFLKDARFVKNAGGNDINEGGNVFGGEVEFLLSGAGNWITAATNSDTYLANVQITNNSSKLLDFCQSNRGNLITGDLSVHNQGAGNITLARSSSSIFQITGDLIVQHTGLSGNVMLANEGDLVIG
ncbi:MAG: hypothetical protein AAFU64_20200, partial [Bacteroidota bacterium]